MSDNPYGKGLPRAYSREQIAMAKRMLLDAPRVEVLERGTLHKIAKATGLNRSALLRVAYDPEAYASIEPAPAEAVAS